MALDEQLHMGAHGPADGVHNGDALFHLLLVNGHVGLAEGIPFQRPDAQLHGLLGLGGKFLRLPGPDKPGVGIHGHPVPELSAEEGGNRRVEILAGNVPQGNFNAADGAHENGAALPVHIPVDLKEEFLNLQRIPANHHPLQVGDHALKGLLIGAQAGFSPAVESLVGLYLHKSPVGPVGVQCVYFNIRNLQIPSPQAQLF